MVGKEGVAQKKGMKEVGKAAQQFRQWNKTGTARMDLPE